MGFIDDDGSVSNDDFVWRKFLLDGKTSDNKIIEYREAGISEKTGKIVPTETAFRYKKGDDGVSFCSKNRMLEEHLTASDLVLQDPNEVDLNKPIKVYWVAEIPVGETRVMKPLIRFRHDPVEDLFMPGRGLAHCLMGTDNIPPDKEIWKDIVTALRSLTTVIEMPLS